MTAKDSSAPSMNAPYILHKTLLTIRPFLCSFTNKNPMVSTKICKHINILNILFSAVITVPIIMIEDNIRLILQITIKTAININNLLKKKND